MKGIYITNLNPEKSPGYNHKIEGQIKGLCQYNLQIELIYFSVQNKLIIAYYNKQNQKLDILKKLVVNTQNIFLRRLLLLRIAFAQIQKEKPDFLYFRYPRAEPLYIIFLALVRYQFPRIILLHEIPTYPYDQETLKDITLSQKLMNCLDRITRHLLKYYIDRIIAISYQGNIFGITSITIHNGIDVQSVPLIPHNQNQKLRLENSLEIIGVGNIEFWHGYDRVLYGLANYLKQELHSITITIHIVSPDTSEITKLKNLVSELFLSNYVIFEGQKTDKNLERLIQKCSLALGDLGSHRKGISTASALKIRNYIARGIPYVSSGQDSDVPEDFPYCLKVKADDSPLDFSQIREFLQIIYQDPLFPQKMRQFAEQKLDWSVQMKDVADFLQKQNSSQKTLQT